MYTSVKYDICYGLHFVKDIFRTKQAFEKRPRKLLKKKKNLQYRISSFRYTFFISFTY